MIYFNLSISNPWAKDTFDNLWHRDWVISGYKYIELECTSDDSTVLKISVSATARRDHAGLSLELGLLGRSVHLSIYDTRHWDRVTGTWQSYDEK